MCVLNQIKGKSLLEILTFNWKLFKESVKMKLILSFLLFAIVFVSISSVFSEKECDCNRGFYPLACTYIKRTECEKSCRAKGPVGEFRILCQPNHQDLVGNVNNRT